MPSSINDLLIFRIIKRIFITGFVKILPTLLVISILVIAYNFLERYLGRPINTLIKSQLAGPWKGVAIKVMGVDPRLYDPVRQETYEEMVDRIKQSSPDFLEAEMKFEEAKQAFETMGGWERINRRTLIRDDPDYARFLEEEIERARRDSGLEAAERRLERERVKMRALIQAEKQRIETEDWTESRRSRLQSEIEKRYPGWLGIVLAFVLIFFVGLLFSSVAGRSLTRYWEGLLKRLPLLGRMYPYTKQLTEFLFADKPVAKQFDRVVAIEYPRKGIYTLGFLTGAGIIPTPGSAPDKKLVSVFVPSSPTPFTGYTLMIAENEVIPLELSVEETLRFCISGGVLKPHQLSAEIPAVELPPAPENANG